jgi:hypothetical protein
VERKRERESVRREKESERESLSKEREREREREREIPNSTLIYFEHGEREGGGKERKRERPEANMGARYNHRDRGGHIETQDNLKLIICYWHYMREIILHQGSI